MEQELIHFVRSKDYKLVEEIGQGGTGRTVLLKDEHINEEFVCKKYSPFYEEHRETYYKNFVDEIKILHLLYHQNVVRVFNYYLYPEESTGYILMEYIKGHNIAKFLKKSPEKLNEIFVQVIRGFRHLEENDVLHRDIRPENILVSNKGIAKIIDFGFGKKINFNEGFDNSVSLNWRYDVPRDFENKKYNFITEVYFVGKLFEEIIQETNLQNFAFSRILIQMIQVDPIDRISSFFEVDRNIISDNVTEIDFEEEEKEIYQKFATSLTNTYTKIEESSTYIRDIDKIIMSMEDVYRNSMLESSLQNPVSLSRCFVKGQFFFRKSAEVPVEQIQRFVQFFKSAPLDKQRIILNNLWQRLDSIETYFDGDELPF